MTVNPDHFIVADDAIGPQPWMQMRVVNSGTVASLSRSYDPTDGQARNDLLQTLQMTWTNDTPVAQWVWGTVGTSGRRVTLQCRSRGYLATSHSVDIVPAGMGAPSFDMEVVSLFGIGTDLGAGGLLAIGGAYGISDWRNNSTTSPLMPHVTGWFLIAPGDTFGARIEVAFVSEFWENTLIDGGDGDTEATIVTGDLSLALYAVPAAVTPPPRAVPYIVGGSANITSASVINELLWGGTITCDVPDDMMEGDHLIAIVANNTWSGTGISPLQDGWTLVHERQGQGDVQLKVYAREVSADSDEAMSYGFANPGIWSEITVAMLAVRDAGPYMSIYGLDWVSGSTISKTWGATETHTAPTIDRRGQYLLAYSFFRHSPLDGPIHQTPPAGMTEVFDSALTNTSLALAELASPPRPTGERTFVPSRAPSWNGHSITGVLLIPGYQEPLGSA